MIKLYGIIVFVFGYLLCYQEAEYREKYGIIVSDSIKKLISFPAKCLAGIPLLKRVVKVNVKILSLPKLGLLFYMLISIVPTFLYFFIDDEFKVAASWCVMFMFMLGMTTVVYYVIDIILERRWIFLKLIAIAFMGSETFVMTLMCIVVARDLPGYIILTLLFTVVFWIIILAKSRIEHL